MYGCDYRWWKHHIADISRDYNGQCWTQDVQWEEAGKKVDPAQWGIKQLISIDQPGLSRKQGTIHRGGNSGFQAVGLAYGELGATRIYLLGFDMCTDGDKRHFFGNHPQPMNMASNYNNFVNAFKRIKPEQYGIEILNVSRRTALTCFPCHNLDDL